MVSNNVQDFSAGKDICAENPDKFYWDRLSEDGYYDDGCKKNLIGILCNHIVRDPVPKLTSEQTKIFLEKAEEYPDRSQQIFSAIYTAAKKNPRILKGEGNSSSGGVFDVVCDYLMQKVEEGGLKEASGSYDCLFRVLRHNSFSKDRIKLTVQDVGKLLNIADYYTSEAGHIVSYVNGEVSRSRKDIHKGATISELRSVKEVASFMADTLEFRMGRGGMVAGCAAREIAEVFSEAIRCKIAENQNKKLCSTVMQKNSAG